MTTNNKISKKGVRSTASPEKKKELANARRRLRRAEKRCEEAQAKAQVATVAADEARDKALRLLGELKAAMGIPKTRRIKRGPWTLIIGGPRPAGPSTRWSKGAADKISKFLSEPCPTVLSIEEIFTKRG
jgi:hypothetical protein